MRYRASAMIELPPIGRNNSIHLNNRKNEGETTVSPSFCLVCRLYRSFHAANVLFNVRHAVLAVLCTDFDDCRADDRAV